MSFVAAFPAWCGADGMPLSHRHYVYGLRYLGRQHLRTQLREAQAVRAAGSTDESWREWQQDLTRMTEAPR